MWNRLLKSQKHCSILWGAACQWHAISTDRAGRRDHSDIGVTLNTYTHVNAKDAITEMRELYKHISEMDSEGKLQKKSKKAI